MTRSGTAVRSGGPSANRRRRGFIFAVLFAVVALLSQLGGSARDPSDRDVAPPAGVDEQRSKAAPRSEARAVVPAPSAPRAIAPALRTSDALLRLPPSAIVAMAIPSPEPQPASYGREENWIELKSPSANDAGAPDAREIARRWQDEQRDDTWSAQMKEYVQNALRDLDVHGEVHEVSCHTSLCKLRMSFEGIDEARTLADGAGQPEQRALARVRLEQSGLSLELFLSRAQGDAPSAAQGDQRRVVR